MAAGTINQKMVQFLQMCTTQHITRDLNHNNEAEQNKKNAENRKKYNLPTFCYCRRQLEFTSFKIKFKHLW